MTAPARHDEADELRRQRELLRALWRRAEIADARWRDDPARAALGLAAYRNNGRALAERALSAAFPTVAQLIGEASFAGLARAFWHRHPPTDGDVATYGADLPGFIAADAQLADTPYLADVARLDWAVHRAESAADAQAQDAGLHQLGGEDAERCVVRLRPGTAVLASPWPVVELWQAHRHRGGDRFASVAAALAAGSGQCALVYREGWRACVTTLPGEAAVRFTSALLSGEPLGAALGAAGADFAFEAWLVQALSQQWLLAVHPAGANPPGGPEWPTP